MAPRWTAILVLALAVGSAAVAHGADAPAAVAAAATSPPESPRPAASPGPEVPRGALAAFLAAAAAGDYERAADQLDLAQLPRASRANEGARLARQLAAVLERTVSLDLSKVSDEPEGDRDDGLLAKHDQIATIDTPDGPVPILLEREPRAGGAPVWRFAPATVARIPALYAQFGYGPFADFLPEPFTTIRFLGLQLWQWLGFMVLIAVAVGGSWAMVRLLGRVATPLMARRGWNGGLVEHAGGPLTLALIAAAIAAGLPLLALALVVERVLTGGTEALAIVAVTWLGLRLLDVLSNGVQRHFVERRQFGALSMVPLIRRVLKIFIAVIAFVLALQNFGFNITGVAAGLGIGGLAIALAAQKTVENLFGGVTLIADQAVRVGDFCRFGETVGTVEDIGLRSTRVRTVDRTLVTIPNAQFSAMPLENLSRRDRIPIRATLALPPSSTGAHVREVLARLRAMLAEQPKVDASSARARFVRLEPAALDIELFAYVLTADWNEYVERREQIFLAALDVVGDDAKTLK